LKKGLLERILNFIGFEQVEVPEDEDAEEAAGVDPRSAHPVRQEASPSEPGRPHLVSIPGAQRGMRVIIVEPDSFDEVAGIVDHLRNRQPTIVVLEDADKELARRVVDFVSGATYALQGVTRRISPGVFLFAPPNVDVAAPGEEEETER